VLLFIVSVIFNYYYFNLA